MFLALQSYVLALHYNAVQTLNVKCYRLISTTLYSHLLSPSCFSVSDFGTLIIAMSGHAHRTDILALFDAQSAFSPRSSRFDSSARVMDSCCLFLSSSLLPRGVVCPLNRLGTSLVIVCYYLCCHWRKLGLSKVICGHLSFKFISKLWSRNAVQDRHKFQWYANRN